ncbi:replication protein a 70 kda DNA-binding subunit a [Anaeramoeba ignava]|uniref:Replication protein a 70 kDa DNA-binding subunit a n=1 Tax=Anaeramoeba ignava TaxID=1746090 RepID=A0A9Q0LFM5_ANAIG|nr:replication protein a 70 kda DNA-binding subunit a [Anaeramoeba ignava]
MEDEYEPPTNEFSGDFLEKLEKENDPDSQYTPISQLNPSSKDWIIKVRVLKKSDIRNFANRSQNGKLFSIDLLDKFGTEIRATIFNDDVDLFYNQFQVGKIYLISKGIVKDSKPGFSHGNSGYQINLNSNSSVTLQEDDENIAKFHFDFLPLVQIDQFPKGSTVDMVGVLQNLSPISVINTRNGETSKRSGFLCDKNSKIDLVFWGESAKNIDISNFEEPIVLAIKSGKIGEYQTKNLSISSTSQLYFNPNLPVARDLIRHFTQNGNDTDLPLAGKIVTKNYNWVTRPRFMIQDIMTIDLGEKKSQSFVIAGTIINITSSNFDKVAYPSCPSENCSKKMKQIGDRWYCEKCDQDYPNCEYKYILKVHIADSSNFIFTTAFNDVAEELLSVKASYLNDLFQSQKTQEYEQVFQKIQNRRFLFFISIYENSYMEKLSRQYRISSFVPLEDNCIVQSQQLIQFIQMYF